VVVWSAQPNLLVKKDDKEGVDDFGVFKMGDMAGVFDDVELVVRDLFHEEFDIHVGDGLVVAAPEELDGDAGSGNGAVFLHGLHGRQVADGGEDGAGEAPVAELVAVAQFPVGMVLWMVKVIGLGGGQDVGDEDDAGDVFADEGEAHGKDVSRLDLRDEGIDEGEGGDLGGVAAGESGSDGGTLGETDDVDGLAEVEVIEELGELGGVEFEGVIDVGTVGKATAVEVGDGGVVDVVGDGETMDKDDERAGGIAGEFIMGDAGGELGEAAGEAGAGFGVELQLFATGKDVGDGDGKEENQEDDP